MATTSTELSPADESFGYPFGCEGLMGLVEACEFLGDISRVTLQRRIDAGLVRKGRHEGRVVVCRRSIREYIESTPGWFAKGGTRAG